MYICLLKIGICNKGPRNAEFLESVLRSFNNCPARNEYFYMRFFIWRNDSFKVYFNVFLRGTSRRRVTSQLRDRRFKFLTLILILFFFDLIATYICECFTKHSQIYVAINCYCSTYISQSYMSKKVHISWKTCEVPNPLWDSVAGL